MQSLIPFASIEWFFSVSFFFSFIHFCFHSVVIRLRWSSFPVTRNKKDAVYVQRRRRHSGPGVVCDSWSFGYAFSRREAQRENRGAHERTDSTNDGDSERVSERERRKEARYGDHAWRSCPSEWGWALCCVYVEQSLVVCVLDAHTYRQSSFARASPPESPETLFPFQLRSSSYLALMRNYYSFNTSLYVQYCITIFIGRCVGQGGI